MGSSTTTLDRLHSQLSADPSGDVDVLRVKLHRMTAAERANLFEELTSEAGDFTLEQMAEGARRRLGLIAEDIRIAVTDIEGDPTPTNLVEKLGYVEHSVVDAKIVAAFLLGPRDVLAAMRDCIAEGSAAD